MKATLHGIALMVETATDNPTRTVERRNVFNKCGGNLGNSGSVAFMFTQMGVFRLKPKMSTATKWNLS